MQTPLFLRFINNVATGDEICRALYSIAERNSDTATMEIVGRGVPYDLEPFREEFKIMASVVAEDSGAINTAIISYLNEYMSVGLIEFENGSGSKNIERWVGVASEDSPWPEALICYNFSCYLKAQGVRDKTMDFKQCRTCKTFFDHKGPHAVYCSDMCKSKRGSQDASY